MRRIRLGTLAAAVGLLAAVVPLAAAAEISTDEEYVERAEPICKRNVEANKRIFKGAKREVKKGELKKASRHFFRASRAFGRTIRQLAQVPQPPASAAKLGRWLTALRTEKTIIEKIGRALAKGQKHRAESLSLELRRNANRANNIVLGFGFDYCLVDSSRFG
ncbi:MAG: hypothetical protein R2725_03250 [Solirubrobacterales bacterium]